MRSYVVFGLLPALTTALDNGLGQLPGLGWNSDYCTNCSGPIPLHAAAPGQFGAGLRGHGGEAFVKHIADHMHTQKYPTSSGSKTLQELGFRYPSLLSRLPSPQAAPLTPSGAQLREHGRFVGLVQPLEQRLARPGPDALALRHRPHRQLRPRPRHGLRTLYAQQRPLPTPPRSFYVCLTPDGAAARASQMATAAHWIALGTRGPRATRPRTARGSASTRSTGTRKTPATPRASSPPPSRSTGR